MHMLYFACIDVCAPCVCSAHRDHKRAKGPLKPGVVEGCEQSCRRWELNPGPQKNSLGSPAQEQYIAW